MSENQNSLVNLGDKVVGQIELPSLDISPYVGMKVKVAAVEEHEGNFGYYIKIVTETVATLTETDKEGKPISLTATRIFGLQTDKEGQIGWGEKTQLGTFLKKKSVKHYKDLVGKEVVTTSVTNSNDGKDYLSIN
jgi:RNase P/RNase MRP subunit p29